MGGAILAGYGLAEPDNEARIALFDKSEEVCAKTRERFPKMTICSSGRELCSSSDVVILGVKPQVIEGVLSEIAGACTSDKLIISMAAGVDLAFLAEHLGAEIPIIRIMRSMSVISRTAARAFSPSKLRAARKRLSASLTTSKFSLCWQTSQM